MICSQCGHINLENSDVCEKCRHPLVNAKSPPRITTRLVQIQTAVQNLVTGQMTTGEFEEFLNETAAFFFDKYDEIKKMNIPLDMTGEVKRELEMGLLGIETFLSSIEILKEYIRDRKATLLEEGVKTARKASDLVNTALAMNCQNYDIFRESTEEFLRYSSPDYN